MLACNEDWIVADLVLDTGCYDASYNDNVCIFCNDITYTATPAFAIKQWTLGGVTLPALNSLEDIPWGRASFTDAEGLVALWKEDIVLTEAMDPGVLTGAISGDAFQDATHNDIVIKLTSTVPWNSGSSI